MNYRQFPAFLLIYLIHFYLIITIIVLIFHFNLLFLVFPAVLLFLIFLFRKKLSSLVTRLKSFSRFFSVLFSLGKLLYYLLLSLPLLAVTISFDLFADGLHLVIVFTVLGLFVLFTYKGLMNGL